MNGERRYRRIVVDTPDMDQARHEMPEVRDLMTKAMAAMYEATERLSAAGHVHDLPLSEDLFEILLTRRANYARAFAAELVRFYVLYLPNLASVNIRLDISDCFVSHEPKLRKHDLSKTFELLEHAGIAPREIGVFNEVIRANSRLTDGFRILSAGQKGGFRLGPDGIDPGQAFAGWFLDKLPEGRIKNLMLAHNTSVALSGAHATARPRMAP